MMNILTQVQWLCSSIQMQFTINNGPFLWIFLPWTIFQVHCPVSDYQLDMAQPEWPTIYIIFSV